MRLHLAGLILLILVEGNVMASASCIDTSFARSALQYAKSPAEALKDDLLKSPGLRAIIRHRASSGTPNISAEEAFNSLKFPKDNFSAISNLIDKVENQSELCSLWKESAGLLPGDFQFKGKIFFILGYDIGVASPPDILINLAHPKILKNPSEIEPYIIHETHHIGFFQYQSPPSIDHIDQKESLLHLIKWATQSEGLAVHAAYPYRKTHNLLNQDGDYLIYSDEAERKRVISEYRRLYTSVLNAKSPVPNFGEVLEKMSSDQRLWYRLGAWVSASIERKSGKRKLTETLSKPDVFWIEVEKIIALH